MWEQQAESESGETAHQAAFFVPSSCAPPPPRSGPHVREHMWYSDFRVKTAQTVDWESTAALLRVVAPLRKIPLGSGTLCQQMGLGGRIS